jgi:Flavodoxin
MTTARALVVYESMFGNTADLAHAVAEGLAIGVDVEVVEVHDAPDGLDEGYDLVVLGAPTHAFSMSRPATREEARAKGAAAAADLGLREWMDDLDHGPHHPAVAAFDTRVGRVRRLPGSAARRAVRVARRLGYRPACAPESFFVADVAGPLAEGERERATAWGRRLAAPLLRP